MSPQAPPRYALIVGVDDYSGFDQSTGQAPGSSDLRGAIADAMAFIHIAGRAGVPSGQTRVLLGARPDAAPMLPGGITAGLADRESVLSGLRWLAEGLASADDAVGLLCFAGHGAASDDDLLLCPSDVDAELHNAVAYREIEALLGEAAQRGALTVILDAAHGPNLHDPAARARSLSRGPLAEALVDRALALDAAIVCASAPGAYGMEARFEQSHRGVLSHALELLMGSFATNDAAVPFQISTEDLVSRVGRMAGALGVPQAPVALGSERRLKDAALAPRGTAVPREGGLAMLFGSEMMPGTTEAGFVAYGLAVLGNNQGNLANIVAGGGHLFVFGGTKTWTGTFSTKRSYWYWPKDSSQSAINPFAISDDQSFALLADLAVPTSARSPSDAKTCFNETDFPTSTGPSNVDLNTLTGSVTRGRLFKITSGSVTLGYLVVSQVSTSSSQRGMNTSDKQIWVKSAPDTALTINTDLGQAIVFTPVTDTSDLTCNGWQVTDARTQP